MFFINDAYHKAEPYNCKTYHNPQIASSTYPHASGGYSATLKRAISSSRFIFVLANPGPVIPVLSILEKFERAKHEKFVLGFSWELNNYKYDQSLLI